MNQAFENVSRWEPGSLSPGSTLPHQTSSFLVHRLYNSIILHAYGVNPCSPSAKTPNLEPYALNPEPQTLNCKPWTLNPRCKPLNHKPQTSNPKP